jgi:hypothetical protein
MATVSALAVLGLLMGCQSDRKATDHFDDDGIKGKVTVVDNDMVALDLPVVDVAHDTVYIHGSVHRKPGVTGAIEGRVDIEFLSPEGEYLDGLPALLTPRAVPFDSNEPATYTTSYGYVPPKGSIVRIHFVDRETMVKEDLQGTDFSYGGSNDAHGGGGAGGGMYQGGGRPINQNRNSNPGHSTSAGHSNSYDNGFGNDNFGARHW